MMPNTVYMVVNIYISDDRVTLKSPVAIFDLTAFWHPLKLAEETDLGFIIHRNIDRK